MRAKSVLGLVVVGCVAVLLAACSTSDERGGRSPGQSAETPGPHAVPITSGDCLSAEMGGGIAGASVVPCADPHDQEAFYLFELSGGEYPGDDAIWTTAEQNCGSQFEMFIGVPYTESALDWFYFSPSPQSWAEGERFLVCTVYDPSGPVSGTLAGAVR